MVKDNLSGEAYRRLGLGRCSTATSTHAAGAMSPRPSALLGCRVGNPAAARTFNQDHDKLTAGDSDNPTRGSEHSRTDGERCPLASAAVGPANREAVAKRVRPSRQEAERPALRVRHLQSGVTVGRDPHSTTDPTAERGGRVLARRLSCRAATWVVLGWTPQDVVPAPTTRLPGGIGGKLSGRKALSRPDANGKNGCPVAAAHMTTGAAHRPHRHAPAGLGMERR